MTDRAFSIDLYEDLSTLGDILLEEKGGDAFIERSLDSEFDIDYPPISKSSKKDYIAASFGISYILADSYSDTRQGYFYENRAEGFHDFTEDVLNGNSSYKTQHFIQLGMLYNEITGDEEVSQIMQPKKFAVSKATARDHAADIIENLLAGLDTENYRDGKKGLA